MQVYESVDSIRWSRHEGRLYILAKRWSRDLRKLPVDAPAPPHQQNLCNIPLCKEGPYWQEHLTLIWSQLRRWYSKFEIYCNDWSLWLIKLSLDGGGVRGLSTLYTLKGLMARLNHERQAKNLPPVKPCKVFDLIGGTSTGGYTIFSTSPGLY